ncbi:MAG TPA: diguanylate cyclase [Alphaproteobacteria bacterium]|jgi:diguanylate cyclase (GGDEF)-like protein/PAS domain S-box-containing protein|nr:diguanylate cyclase [Alphaproteobacteria bacterium]
MTKSAVPLKAGSATGERAPADAATFGDWLSLMPERVLEGFSGPGLLLDKEGTVLAANGEAEPLVPAFSEDGDRVLRGLAAAAAASGRTVSEKLDLPKEFGGLALELLLLPLKDRDGTTLVLVLSREFTVERNFMAALLASRQLFKDLVSCSADFAWETEASGNFAFVSQQGALGYTAHELNRRSPRQLIHPRHDEGEPFPFDSRLAHEESEVWMRRADGSPACLRISSVPIYSDAGDWLGCRGVARDVSDARARDLELERAHNRERLLNAIVNTIREEVVPDQMLLAAAEATAGALGARHCWIFRRTPLGQFAKAVEHDEPPGSTPEAAVRAAQELIVHGDPQNVVESKVGNTLMLTSVARYRGEINGAISACRDNDQPAWNAADRKLLAGVADHLGIALEQIANHEALERLSRTDELTGLSNRRAFFDDLEKRLAHQRRTQRPGALLYVDLDNFKPVNDVHGHHTGDAVLIGVSELLAGGTRVGDLAARLGGDEFALWLEESDEPAAIVKAETLLDQIATLSGYSADAARPLGFSIGIALSDAAVEEGFKDLVGRADEAMYQAKYAGKGGYVVGVPASKVTEHG